MSINNDIDYVKRIIKEANSVLSECVDGCGKWEDEKELAARSLKKAFSAALSLCTKYSLNTDAESIRSTLAEVDDLVRVDEYGNIGVFYLYWGARLLSHLDIIEKLYGKGFIGEFPASLDLTVQIIRRAEYAMEGLKQYHKNERELDEFIENLLRLIYPDLLTTPTLPKSIKNFEPDTGIPSLQLLIEYKYLASKEDAKRVADEILADTAGYKSGDWSYYLFIIYEQRRFVPEVEWNNLLQQCGTAKNTWTFVIPGVPLVT